MNEARRSQEYDEAEAAQLSAQQATRTAETFFAPTVTPGPATPLPPTLESLVVTLGVGPDGGPSGSYLSVPTDAGTAYAAGRLSNVQAGQHISAVWTDAAGNWMGSFELDLTADAASQWVSVPLQVGGVPGPGEYAVYLYGGNHQLGSLAFTITGPGSGAQLLPDLPANPQARATSVPRTESRDEDNDGGGQQGDNQRSEGDWQQNQQPQQDQWNQPQQDQWNQPQQDQWNQPQDQWNQPQDQWNQQPQG